MSTKISEKVTQQMIEQLEAAIQEGGSAPWSRPWTGYMEQKNYVSQKPYRGINRLLLAPGEYLTFNQIKALQKKDPDIKLRKGSKGKLVVFFNFFEKEEKAKNHLGDVELKMKRIPILKQYTVFNVADVDNLPPRTEVELFETSTVEEIDLIMKDYFDREDICFEQKLQNEAYYCPSLDSITVPAVVQFEAVADYYGTVFHESVHSTGHTKRLGRFESGGFGSNPYAKEELVAEMGACFLAQELGVTASSTLDNNVAYLRSWIKQLKDDTNLIISAASQAQKAVDLILKRTFEEDSIQDKD